MSAIRRLGWVALALGVGVPVALFVSAQFSLDREFGHTRRTLQLGWLSEGTSDGLVRVRVGSNVFRTRIAGLDNSGPAVMFLHGFPETSAMWEPMLRAAASAGFRAAAFDQRGYSPGARPQEVSAYTVEELRRDVLAVADALEFERFHLVGHDWGSMVGWSLAANEPERVRSWTSLSIPHPRAVSAVRGDAGPPLYVKVFRTPGVAETIFSAFGMALMRSAVYAEMPEDQLEEYLQVFAEPGALRAAFNWYRAIANLTRADGLAGAIHQPTLYVWGNRDMPVFVGPRVQREHPRFLTGPFRSVELDAGHWLMQEQGDRVVAAVMDHLEQYREHPTDAR